MFLCAKCHLSVSSVCTVHSSNNKVCRHKRKGEEKTKRKEFVFILASGASLFDQERHTAFLLLPRFSPCCSRCCSRCRYLCCVYFVLLLWRLDKAIIFPQCNPYANRWKLTSLLCWQKYASCQHAVPRSHPVMTKTRAGLALCKEELSLHLLNLILCNKFTDHQIVREVNALCDHWFYLCDKWRNGFACSSLRKSLFSGRCLWK